MCKCDKGWVGAAALPLRLQNQGLIRDVAALSFRLPGDGYEERCPMDCSEERSRVSAWTACQCAPVDRPRLPAQGLPQQLLDHGSCKEGKCICDVGYKGELCITW